MCGRQSKSLAHRKTKKNNAESASTSANKGELNLMFQFGISSLAKMNPAILFRLK